MGSPTAGTWKLNTDASFIPSMWESAVGFIVRDYRGLVAVSGGNRLPSCKDPEEAELAAILHGLSVVSKIYLGPLCVETDCASILALLDFKLHNQSTLFPLVTDSRDLMKMFSEVTIKAVRRSSNNLAHELAALARIHGDYKCIGDVPLTLKPLLMENCIISSVVI